MAAFLADLVLSAYLKFDFELALTVVPESLS